MTVHTICDRCGMEYDHVGVQVGGQIFCCQGCASGGPCTCVGSGNVVVTDGPVVVERRTPVVADDVVIIE